MEGVLSTELNSAAEKTPVLGINVNPVLVEWHKRGNTTPKRLCAVDSIFHDEF